RVGRPAFSDVVAEALVFPIGVSDQAEAERRIEAAALQFFEGTWLQRPLKSLGGVAPIDAAGHAVLRRKLRGVIQFLQDCAGDGDRYPYFSYLSERALAGGNTTEALDAINEGEKADCEQNEGRRRNDYELRRAKLHARRGEPDAAHDVFERLIQRDPTNLKT